MQTVSGEAWTATPSGSQVQLASGSQFQGGHGGGQTGGLGATPGSQLGQVHSSRHGGSEGPKCVNSRPCALPVPGAPAGSSQSRSPPPPSRGATEQRCHRAEVPRSRGAGRPPILLEPLRPPLQRRSRLDAHCAALSASAVCRAEHCFGAGGGWGGAALETRALIFDQFVNPLGPPGNGQRKWNRSG